MFTGLVPLSLTGGGLGRGQGVQRGDVLRVRPVLHPGSLSFFAVPGINGSG